MRILSLFVLALFLFSPRPAAACRECGDPNHVAVVQEPATGISREADDLFNEEPVTEGENVSRTARDASDLRGEGPGLGTGLVRTGARTSGPPLPDNTSPVSLPSGKRDQARARGSLPAGKPNGLQLGSGQAAPTLTAQAPNPLVAPTLPTKEDQANIAAHFAYGAQTGDFSGARRYIEESLERYPDHPGFKQYQRLVEQRVKAPDAKALSAKIAALAYEPQGGEAAPNPQLAGVMALGAPGAAPLGALAPGAPGLGAPRDAGQSGAAPSVRPAGGAAPAVREAFRLIHIGDAVKAERALLRHLENEPKDAEAWRMLALAQYKQKRYADSIESANGALALDHRDYHARGLKIRDLMGLERWLDAENEASTLLEQHPRDPWAFTWRADAREAQGKADAALEDRKTAAEIAPDGFSALYEEALHARSGKKAPAPPAALGKRSALWIGALGTAFLFLSFAVYRKRGDSSVRVALRQEDHDAAVASAPRADAVPQGFRVVKTLGMGGMGVVYEAVDLALQRTVALKKMRDEVAANPRERARFLKEARVVAGLRHPHIVEIYSIQENSDGLFLVFERVPGETLHDRLGKGPLSPAEALPLLRQVAAALDYAHAAGVVHQDLKPANIMVHGGSVKVMDFGIARRVQETLSTMSRVEVAGTPAYMSPEQEQGGAVGPAADLFAFGVCAYEMLTGRLPFPQGGLMAKAQGLYRPATDVTPLPKSVDGELGRALAPTPQGRHASATAFVDALGRALS